MFKDLEACVIDNDPHRARDLIKGRLQVRIQVRIHVSISRLELGLGWCLEIPLEI